MDSIKKKRIKRIMISILAFLLGLGIVFTFINISNFNAGQNTTKSENKPVKTVNYNSLFTGQANSFNLDKYTLLIDNDSYSIIDAKTSSNRYSGGYDIIPVNKEDLKEINTDISNYSKFYIIKCYFDEHYINEDVEYYNGNNKDYCFIFYLAKNNDSGYSLIEFDKNILFNEFVF